MWEEVRRAFFPGAGGGRHGRSLPIRRIEQLTRAQSVARDAHDPVGRRGPDGHAVLCEGGDQLGDGGGIGCPLPPTVLDCVDGRGTDAALPTQISPRPVEQGASCA